MNKFEQNRKSWNEMTGLHAASGFYDLKAFKQGKSSLNHIELEELGGINGKKLLHLQCHFGMDTLSLARLGANVTGIDISDTSIEKARELSDELDIPARFIRTNVFDLENVPDKRFDIIFTSYGAINWLDDLNEWARIIYRYLKPNGFFYMVEFHPFVYTLNDHSEIENSYFKTKAIETDVESSYTDNSEVSQKNLKHIEWHHSLGETVNSLISSGLSIEFLNEFPYQVYNCFPGMIENEPEKWTFEKHGKKIPYLFSLKARKPNDEKH